MAEIQIEAMVKALALAHEITERFEKKYGRPPTDVEYKIASTLVPKAGNSNGNGGNGATRTESDPGTISECPKCQGPVWDNRAAKKDGTASARAPNYKCKNQECGWAQWPPRKKKAGVGGRNE